VLLKVGNLNHQILEKKEEKKNMISLEIVNYICNVLLLGKLVFFLVKSVFF
jgi:hypothetical protein